jgi:CheY-like chemotaxis protein
MTGIASALRTNLPFLRRYARCLTGQQEAGDAAVAALIERITADPSLMPTDMDARVALFRAFTRMWNDPSLSSGHAGVHGTTLVDSRLDAITPLPRQAFLLVAVEGFTPDEAALVTDRSRDQIEADLDMAGREIAAQVATDVLIIEDEPLIALDLRNVVTGIGHTVIDIARTKDEAVSAVARRKPGLMLVDVQLADGTSGLDAVREILGSISIPVIFITAFPEEVLTGARPEPTFLIPKPFKPDTVKTIVSQALFFSVRASNVNPAGRRPATVG